MCLYTEEIPYIKTFRGNLSSSRTRTRPSLGSHLLEPPRKPKKKNIRYIHPTYYQSTMMASTTTARHLFAAKNTTTARRSSSHVCAAARPTWYPGMCNNYMCVCWSHSDFLADALSLIMSRCCCPKAFGWIHARRLRIRPTSLGNQHRDSPIL